MDNDFRGHARNLLVEIVLEAILEDDRDDMGPFISFGLYGKDY